MTSAAALRDGIADGLLATHPLVSAIPFFVPTFIVVAVIGVIIWRDRHRTDEAAEADDAHNRD